MPLSPRTSDARAPTLSAPPEREFAFVGRQPIFDAELQVYGYELLFRRGEENAAFVDDAEEATAQVFCSTFMDIGLDAVVGSRRAFVNLSRGFLLGSWPELFPASRVVLEILEAVEPDREVLDRVERLRGAGYSIALDDFVLTDENLALARLAHIVKIDVLGRSADELRGQVDRLRSLGVKLLAEKVETAEELEFCKSLGMEYFQGYFLCRPSVLKGPCVRPDRTMTLELLRQVSRPAVCLEDLAAIVARDVSISYKLLRYMNSAWFSLPMPISSIEHALRLLGVDQVCAWVRLLLLARLSDKPAELLATAVLRGRMCQELNGTSEAAGNEAFTAGLFSTLDALLDQPLDQAVASVHLAESLEAAIVRREGPIGKMLACVLDYERGDWDRSLAAGRFAPEKLRSAWLNSLEWLHQVSDLMKAD